MRTRAVVAAVLLAAAPYFGAPVPRADALDVSAAKRAFEAREEAQHARAWRAPKHPGFLPRSRTAINWAHGIVESGLAPLPAERFDIANQWHGEVGGRHVVVYAGAYRKTDRGVLVVLQLALDGSAAAAPRFIVLAPHAGRARIVQARPGTLLIATSSGMLFPLRLPS